jgi:hypothetical protein
LIVSDKGTELCFSFSIPSSCPFQSPMGCSGSPNLVLESSENSMTPDNQDLSTPEKQMGVLVESMITSALHLKRKQSKAPMVVTEVRSVRLKGKHQGFKLDSCPDRDYFCCNPEAPTLSSKVIKSLGKDFCHISEASLTDENLRKKHLTKKVVVPRAKQSKKGSKDKDVSNDESKKKNKKN